MPDYFDTAATNAGLVHLWCHWFTLLHGHKMAALTVVLSRLTLKRRFWTKGREIEWETLSLSYDYGYYFIPINRASDASSVRFPFKSCVLNAHCLPELRSCVKVEVAVLGSPSLTVLTVSVDVKQHWTLQHCLLAGHLVLLQFMTDSSLSQSGVAVDLFIKI